MDIKEYDSRIDTINHIREVQRLIGQIVERLFERSLTLRHSDGDFDKSLKINKERFKISNEL